LQTAQALGVGSGTGEDGTVRQEGKGNGIFCWSFQSDFTNEMGKYYEIDRVGKKGLPCPFS